MDRCKVNSVLWSLESSRVFSYTSEMRFQMHFEVPSYVRSQAFCVKPQKYKEEQLKHQGVFQQL